MTPPAMAPTCDLAASELGLLVDPKVGGTTMVVLGTLWSKCVSTFVSQEGLVAPFRLYDPRRDADLLERQVREHGTNRWAAKVSVNCALHASRGSGVIKFCETHPATPPPLLGRSPVSAL